MACVLVPLVMTTEEVLRVESVEEGCERHPPRAPIFETRSSRLPLFRVYSHASVGKHACGDECSLRGTG